MESSRETERVQLHIFAGGRVQGVGFRMYTKKEAEALKLSGWIKNLPDGRVEIIVQGKESRLQRFIKWCQKGPPSARVADLEIERSIVSKLYASFEIL